MTAAAAYSAGAVARRLGIESRPDPQAAALPDDERRSA